jgi:hypothetical protein
MNVLSKRMTVRRYHYDSHHQLRQHIQTFLDAYNFAKRLKTLNGFTITGLRRDCTAAL